MIKCCLLEVRAKAGKDERDSQISKKERGIMKYESKILKEKAEGLEDD